MDIAQLLPQTTIFVGGCPDIIARQYLRDAAREFARETRLWRISMGTADIEIDPSAESLTLKVPTNARVLPPTLGSTRTVERVFHVTPDANIRDHLVPNRIRVHTNFSALWTDFVTASSFTFGDAGNVVSPQAGERLIIFDRNHFLIRGIASVNNIPNTLSVNFTSGVLRTNADFNALAAIRVPLTAAISLARLAGDIADNEVALDPPGNDTWEDVRNADSVQFFEEAPNAWSNEGLTIEQGDQYVQRQVGLLTDSDTVSLGAVLRSSDPLPSGMLADGLPITFGLAETPAYSIVKPTDSDLVTIDDVLIDGESLRAREQDGDEAPFVYDAVREELVLNVRQLPYGGGDTSSIEVFGVFQPSLTANRLNHVFSAWSHAIRTLAVHWMLLMPNREWSDPRLAMRFRSDYLQMVSDAYVARGRQFTGRVIRAKRSTF